MLTIGSYRLNIFGFPGIPDHPNNLALLDQRLAIEVKNLSLCSISRALYFINRGHFSCTRLSPASLPLKEHIDDSF
jgi:hypothetical protein